MNTTMIIVALILYASSAYIMFHEPDLWMVNLAVLFLGLATFILTEVTINNIKNKDNVDKDRID